MRRQDQPWDAVTLRALPSTEVSHLHLLRHGHVDTGGQRLAYGHLDLPLSAEGRQSSRALLALVRDGLPPVDRVYGSDLSRCAPLATALGEACGAPVALSPLLREQHMGAWEGRSWAELTAADEDRVQAWWADYLHSRAPGGESLADLAARVDRWWAQEAPTLAGRRVVVVTHIGVIRVLLCRALGLPLDQALRWAPARGSHTWLVHGQAGFVLQGMGEKPPEPDAPLASAAPRRLALSGKLWQEQVAREDRAVADHGGYVADRSPWDFAAFWLHYRFASDRRDTERFFAEVRARAADCERILLLPWGVLPLHDDGVRSTNPWLQRHFQACVEGLLARELPPERLLRLPAEATSLPARLQWVVEALGASEP
ncbi:alpha-ribazole phosphatase family protein [Myxococcota bacterium]|nr:alpha-ribazole phosphatase family protein [Myxococcota bacterium]